MKLRPVPAWQLSKRVEVKPGSIVRLIGSGGTLRCRLPGKFRVNAIYRKRTRVYLEITGIDKTGGTYTVFVQGRPYRRLGVRWKPFRVKRERTTCRV